MPPPFHSVGPLRASAPAPLPPAPAGSAGQRLVFASLGTLQGHRAGIFLCLARACRDLGLRLLVAHCGGLDRAQEQQLLSAGATWVTDFVNQASILRRASVAVTHAGLNTVMDAIAAGVPMLAIPIAFDQPGIAARIVHAGIGLRLSPRGLRTAAVRAALEALLQEPAYRHRARPLAAELAQAGGARRAADLCESLLKQHGGYRAHG